MWYSFIKSLNVKPFEMKLKPVLFIYACFSLIACSPNNSETENTQTENPASTEAMYFPPSGSDVWETKSLSSLGWHQDKVQDLLNYLQTKNSKSFIILQNGRIVMKIIFSGHTATTLVLGECRKNLNIHRYRNCRAGRFLNINNKVSAYIGTGWTSAPLAKENLITCKNLLSMTSGLDDSLGDDVSPANLQYKTDAGTRWAYHNVYVKLQDVVAAATGQTWTQYFNTKLRDKIGMTGNWIQSGDNSVYWSTTRSMARFGLMALNNGNWNGNQIINSAYFQNATNTSQNINLAYGYLWWLNGKSSYHLPQTQFQFNGKLIPSAPDDMFCALGKMTRKSMWFPVKNSHHKNGRCCG